MDAIGEWAKQKFNLKKIPDRNTISKIKREKDETKKSIEEGNLEKKSINLSQSISVDTAFTSWV